MKELNAKSKKWVDKMTDTLKLGGRSNRTIDNYVCAIKRFLCFYDDNADIRKFKEEDIVSYIKTDYIDKGRAGSTYNMNICAIKYFYSVCFNINFNSRLLPSVKLIKRLPSILDKDLFISIFNDEKHINHKCWLLLGFYSGLRVEEISTVKIENIDSKNHRLKVIGKNKKERFTLLPDITIKFLRLYYKHSGLKDKTGFLFKGNSNNEHINSRTIVNYFIQLKKIYNLPQEVTFHSLRHSFATYFIMAGGDILTLKSMLGHKSLNTTCIYLHLSRDFNNLKGVKYV